MKNRLLIVSNRLPVQVKLKDGTPEITPSAGGLVSSIKSYLHSDHAVRNSEKPVWIGSVDVPEKKFHKHGVDSILHDNDFVLEPVFIPRATADKFYNGFCNDMIWPLFHYFPSYARFKDEYFDQYVHANFHFCEKIVSIYQPGDVIWIHDYHLMLLPDMLRKLIPDAQIGFFMHIPFPSFELFRMIPDAWRTQVVNGLLGADLIGFHTHSYAQYFLHSVKQLLGHEISIRSVITQNRIVAVGSFPISIEFARFNRVIDTPGIFSERNRIRKKFGEVQIVLSVDRLDYAKGIMNRLEGFELFLNQNPQYIGRVTFLLMIVPSRDAIANYRELKANIEGFVGRINGRFATLDWSPVIYQYRHMSFEELSALYIAADVALITPVRDGMNLVAKEFIAARSDRRGVLILSETAGAAAELGEAIIINPTDRRQIANALLEALNLPPEEQRNRIELMQQRLKNYDVTRWAKDFLRSLHEQTHIQDSFKVKMFTTQVGKQVHQHFRNAGERLLFFDYDGTLTPLRRFPNQAVPGDEVIRLLSEISDDERNKVVIVSGRTKGDLQTWFGNLRVHLIAEHGAYSKAPSEDWQNHLPVSCEWKTIVSEVMHTFVDRCPGSFIEEKDYTVAWHYRNSDADTGFSQSRELHENLSHLATHLDFHVLEGKKVIEVRPRGIDKGASVSKVISHHTADFILAIGDDRTDEDMFRACPPEAFTIRVGVMQSAARYNLKTQPEVVSFLNQLTLPVYNGVDTLNPVQ